MSRSADCLVALISAAISFLAYYLIAHLFNIATPGFVALIVIVSIGVHELCHMAVLEMYGIKSRIIFLVILGGTFPDPQYMEKLKNLPWLNRCQIHLAGVTGNFLIVIACTFLHYAGFLSVNQWAQITELNGNLIFLNLLPFGILDGGRFAKVIFDSIPTYLTNLYAIKITAAAGIALGLVGFFFSGSPVTLVVLIYFGLCGAAKNNDATGYWNSLAIPLSKVRYLLVVYCILVVSGYLMWIAASATWK